MKVEKYKLPYSESDIDFINHHIREVLKKGYLTDGGDYVKLVEKLWAEFVNTNYSIAVNSCTTALELALKAIDVKNSSVIVPTYTFFATPLSVHNAGGKVVYADIDPNTLSLSLDSIKACVTSDVKAIIIVHVGGYITSEIFKIREFCDNNNIVLVEDAACAHGAEMDNKQAGSIGHISTFSFHHSKVLTSGEGGFINTDNSIWAKRIRRMRSIGLDRAINNWEVFELGNNYKMSELTAVLAYHHINKAQDILKERRAIADYYDNNLYFNEHFKKLETGGISSYYKYVINTSNICKTKLTEYLYSKSIDLPPTVYSYLCSNQNINSKISHIKQDYYPNATAAMNNNICLPMYNGITVEQLKYITQNINSFLGKFYD